MWSLYFVIVACQSLSIDWAIGGIIVLKIHVKDNSLKLFEAIVNSYQMLLNISSSVWNIVHSIFKKTHQLVIWVAATTLWNDQYTQQLEFACWATKAEHHAWPKEVFGPLSSTAAHIQLNSVDQTIAQQESIFYLQDLLKCLVFFLFLLPSVHPSRRII